MSMFKITRVRYSSQVKTCQMNPFDFFERRSMQEQREMYRQYVFFFAGVRTSI